VNGAIVGQKMNQFTLDEFRDRLKFSLLKFQTYIAEETGNATTSAQTITKLFRMKTRFCFVLFVDLSHIYQTNRRMI
jgi:hypothetical protein